MNKKGLFGKLAAAPHILWAVLFIVGPLIFVLYYAFTDRSGTFTLKNLTNAFSAQYLSVFIRSVVYSLIATLICLVIAYPVAYSIAQAKPKTQKILIMLIMLPMWMNFLIRVYSLMSIIGNAGIINSMLKSMGLPELSMINTPGAVIFGMVYSYLPYMVLPIYTVMSKMDTRLIEAARDLGCNSGQVLSKVILPLSVSGIVSGVTMVFVPSISTFYISQKLGGGNFDLIGDTIERQFLLSNNYNFGAAISLELMILILFCMTFMNRFSDGDESGGMIV